eukprot:s299_g2.t1
MMARGIRVLLVLKGLWQSWATQCDNDQAVKVGALEQEVTGRSCNISDLNSGDCIGTSVEPKCTDCSPIGGEVIPTTGTGFPSGSLSCGTESCRFETDPPPSNAFYEFRNSADYLTCQNKSACREFDVRNAASICCKGTDSHCRQSAFQLHGDHSCGGDVCCGRGCRLSSFTKVRNMACIGQQACQDASVTLAGDLFVGGTDGSASGTNPWAGRLANFNFTTGGSHCVQTLGATFSQQALRQASLTFEEPSNVRMLCQEGIDPCWLTTVRLPRGSCFHVNCTSESPSTCLNFKVLPLVDGETDFRCYCSGGDACAWTAQPQFSYCENTTADPCGSDICPGTAPVCMDQTTPEPTIDCALLAAPAPACDGSVTGDPHLRTLDGRHYTLTQQGNFLLWGFSGYETEVLATQQFMGSTRKVPVDFEIFTHYAGHASFTKGQVEQTKPSLGSDCQRLSLASLEHLHLASCGVSALETRMRLRPWK